MAANEGYKHDGFPDRNTEYLLYQTMVGSHPISARRLGDFMVKAVREAKAHTSWLRVDEQYERAVWSFVESLCNDHSFIDSLDRFVDRIEPHAIANSLAQVVLKSCLPGIPDFYQGNEVRTFALADPDNRRPVDFAMLHRRLGAISSAGVASVEQSWRSSELSKLWVTHQGLRLRAERPWAFVGERATYAPIEATGEGKGNVLGFVRGGQVAALVSRFSTQVEQGWGATEIRLPDGSWRDVLTSRTHGRLARAGEVFADLPVALLELEASQ
jgi:(1->4)-alpha-D-glucan 1-alpha-D-glucosylmutase